MPCFRPVPCWRSSTVNEGTGKRSIIYSPLKAYILPNGKPDAITRPCGQCKYCKSEAARQWGVRACLESTLYQNNCFVTLTYAPEHLPVLGCLDYDAAPMFMDRLRARFGQGIRSYGCAEYGSKRGRPHYHLCIFNFDFADKKQIRNLGGRDPLFESETLKELWPFGHSSVGSLTFESAAYVASYCTKKLNGPKSHVYEVYDENGECVRWPSGEFFKKPVERSVSVSRMPGIARPWYDRFGSFVRTHDFVVVNGRRMRPPKYFDKLCEQYFPEDFKVMKMKRKDSALEMRDRLEKEDSENFAKVIWKDNVVLPSSRLTVIEIFEELKTQHLKRSIEDE